MARKKREKPQREVTKRQLSRWQQQKRRQRIILIAGIAAIATALGITGGNWYMNSYKPLHEVVVRVDEQEYDMDYYIKMLGNYSQGISAEFISYYADQVISDIQHIALIIKEAEKIGVAVSDEEVEEELENQGLPSEQPYWDMTECQMVLNKLYEEYVDNEVPVSDEQRYILAILLESESQALDVRNRILNGGEVFGDLAAELSLEEYSKENKGDYGWRPEGILTTLLDDSILDDFAFNNEMGSLSEPLYDEDITKSVGYWIVRVVDRDDKLREAQVEAILLGSEQEANEVIALLDEGEDFNQLAMQYSLDAASKDSGGDLGWLTSIVPPELEEGEEPVGIMLDEINPVMDEFVFSCEIGDYSEPLRDDTAETSGGYWLVKILSVDDDKEISEENRDVLKSSFLDEWLQELYASPDYEVESFLDEEMKAWAIERVGQG